MRRITLYQTLATPEPVAKLFKLSEMRMFKCLPWTFNDFVLIPPNTDNGGGSGHIFHIVH